MYAVKNRGMVSNKHGRIYKEPRALCHAHNRMPTNEQEKERVSVSHKASLCAAFSFFPFTSFIIIHLAFTLRYNICLRLQLKCSCCCCLAYANELIMYSLCLLSLREKGNFYSLKAAFMFARLLFILSTWNTQTFFFVRSAHFATFQCCSHGIVVSTLLILSIA